MCRGGIKSVYGDVYAAIFSRVNRRARPRAKDTTILAGTDYRSRCGELEKDPHRDHTTQSQGLANMMEVVIVEVCRASALIVSKKKTYIMCMPLPRTMM